MLKKLLLLLVMAFIFSGCTLNNQPETVSFATWGSATEVKIIKNIITEFEKENPDIKINLLHIPQNYFQKMHLLFASNTPPDVIFINNLYLPLYQKFLMPLNDIVDKNDFYEEAVNALSINDNLYAVPRDISCLVLYVNLDKTTMPDKNWKIEDLLNKSIVLKNDKQFAISYDDKIYSIQPYLSYFGGGILDNDKNLIINTEKSQAALNFYKDLGHKYKTAPLKANVGSFTQAQMFINGKIVFYLSGRWMYPKISEEAKFNWGIINFPYGELPQPLDSSGWAISKNTGHKSAALKFIKYISDTDASMNFAETGLIVPARKSTSKILNTNNHNERIFLEVIEHSSKTNVNKDYSKITDKINKSLDL